MSYRTKNRVVATDAIGLPLIMCLLAIFVGTALAIILGRTFIFFRADAYIAIALPTFLFLLPVIALGLLASARGKAWRSRLSLSRLPHVLGWAIGIALLALSIVASPFGYVALSNEVFGYDTTVQAKVISVVDPIPTKGRDEVKGCKRTATILVSDKKIGICLIDHYPPNLNIQGEDVALQMRRSAFGYRIGPMTLAR